MANPFGADTTLDTSGLPPPPPPTPLQGLTGSLGLVPSFQEAGAREAAHARESTARGRSDLEGLRTKAGEHEQAAAAATPPALALPTPPSTEARPFMVPGKDTLAQVQAALAGATQLALGIGGMRGGGSALGAVAGLKGAIHGWMEGDKDRVERSMAEWNANSDKLLAEHRSRREAYNDLLTSQDRSMQERLAEIGIRARLDGDEQAALTAERGNIGELINLLGTREQQERQFGVQMKTLDQSIAQHNETARRADRAFDATQEQRRVTNKRLEEGLKIRQENQAGLIKLEAEDDKLSNQLRQIDAVQEAVAYLDKKGIIPKGGTWAEQQKAKLALQTSFGDEEVARHYETLKRMGTALLVGSEMSQGMTGGAMRLKSMVEAEAGGVPTIPKSFWDQWFTRQRSAWNDRRASVRRHLQNRTPATGPQASTPEEEYETVDKPD